MGERLALSTGEIRCERCHRRLNACSYERRRFGNLGRSCYARRARAVRALYASRNAAASRAAELIELGALIPMKRPGFYRVPSADGRSAYTTCSRGCTCPAGIHAKLCKHSVAAAVLTV